MINLQPGVSAMTVEQELCTVSAASNFPPTSKGVIFIQSTLAGLKHTQKLPPAQPQHPQEEEESKKQHNTSEDVSDLI
ncbi:hypothetical protein scyTo_0000175 [Scyliorhinus torazame]|uniref:Uncharacterized protein n=1 Tax=Scyliorhinus torazame TaxID=75743 RepID=A0A401NRV4_SCYTO|nr:hypothetical protein [Scyliorhinus torazame]